MLPSLFPDEEHLGLLTDLYELTMAAGYFAQGMADQRATFELWIRHLPESRNYLICAGLEQLGVRVEVAAATRDVCRPHFGSGQGPDGGLVNPDLALTEADASRYSAIVFVGGWGASSYQYAFAGTYANAGDTDRCGRLLRRPPFRC